MKISTCLSSAAAAAVTLAVASVAHATPNFPGALQKIASMPAAPACALCHAGGNGQRGNVTTPFGASMRARGLVANDEASLQKAYDTMTSDKVDSDGDGKLDVDELKAGTDPNTPEGTETITPKYGCVGRVAPSGGTSGGWLAAAALALAALRHRRRR